METTQGKIARSILDVPAWRYYLRYYRQSYWALVVAIGVSIAQAFILFPIGLLVRNLFDQAIPQHDLVRLALVCVTVLALYVLSNLAALWVRRESLSVTKHAILSLREDLLNKVFTLSRAFYSRADIRKFHTAIVQDTERVDVMSNAVASQLIPALFTALALGAVLIPLNWVLFLISFSFVPFLFWLSRSLGSRVRASVQTYNQSFATFSKGILFVLQMMDLTRLQSAEAFEMQRQKEAIKDLRAKSHEMAELQAYYASLHKTIVVSSSVLILVVGGSFVNAGYMTLGELLSFYIIVALMKDHLINVLVSMPQVIIGNESLTELHRISQLEDRVPYAGARLIAFRGEVAFRSVAFSYDERAGLQEINLHFLPHDTVAIVGPNGAGKSTLIHLILGFYRPQSGELYADDHPYSDLDLIALRRQIGIVPQDPLIFPGTIRENISYGSPHASELQIESAAELATANEFIREFPLSYDSFVGENGVLLSGGQRQRIAIARALIRQPKMLILDEPTNHLDKPAILQLMVNLKSLGHAPTTLIISHDISLIEQAQFSVVMQAGRIVRQGQLAGMIDRQPFLETHLAHESSSA